MGFFDHETWSCGVSFPSNIMGLSIFTQVLDNPEAQEGDPIFYKNPTFSNSLKLVLASHDIGCLSITVLTLHFHFQSLSQNGSVFGSQKIIGPENL